MVVNIPIEEIRKLPHVYLDDVQGRIFPLHPLLDESGKWHLWVPQNDKLIDMTAIPVESNYFAKNPEKSEDIIFNFLEFLEKRALWPDIKPWVTAITSDIHNLAASLAKLELFFQTNKSSNMDVRRMVGTELEYIFITCRSLFDLLQMVIKFLWRRITRSTQNLQEQILPNSFADMALMDNKPMSVENIVDRRKIPLELAEFYHRNSKFFQWIRDYRDSISHKDGDFDLIFIDKKGFFIQNTTAPFDNMPIWCDTNTLPNNLGAVKSVASYIISSTLAAFDDAIDLFKTRITFPADVVPNHRMYTRGVHNQYLVNLKKNISNP